MKLTRKLSISHDGSFDRYSYAVEGKKGAIEFWVTKSPIDVYDYFGGVEVHSVKPLYNTEDKSPDHKSCVILSGRPCYHDGSSLMAIEKYIPVWKQCGKNNPEVLWDMLEIKYQSQFCEK